VPDTPTWTVRHTEGGETVQLRPGTRDVLADCLDVLRSEDPDAVLVDLAAELSARFPVGSRVRHTTGGGLGTVTEMDAALFPPSSAPPRELVSCAIDRGGNALVCVHVDGSPYPDWFDAAWIEPAWPATAPNTGAYPSQDTPAAGA
jgi:hypothetical protein